MTSTLPFDDFRNLLTKLPAADRHAADRMRALFGAAGGPGGSLGGIEDIAAWLAAWSGRSPPMVMRPLVAIFAGNHGVVRQGVSAYSMAATAEAVERIAAGGAAVSQVCIAGGLGLQVFDLALDVPTGDISREAALDERACAATMAFGMEAVAGGADLLCLGDLGVGNSTVAAALLAAIHGGNGADWIDTGSETDVLLAARAISAVDAALSIHRSHLKDPLEALRHVGGREPAALCGAILAARMQKIPVLIDGLAGLASASVLKAVDPGAVDHCLLASLPPGRAAAKAAELLGLEPLLDLGVSQGQGVGSALAAGLVKAAAQIGSGMAAIGRN